MSAPASPSVRIVGKRRVHAPAPVQPTFDRWREARAAADPGAPALAAAAAAEILLRWEIDEDRTIALDPADPADVERILATEEGYRDAENLVRSLSPAARAVHGALVREMGDWLSMVRGRLDSDRGGVLAVVRCPSHRWYDDVSAAYRAWIGLQEAAAGCKFRAVDRHTPQKAYGGANEREFQTGRIIEDVGRRHVLAVHTVAESVPAVLVGMADAIVVLDVTTDDLVDAVAAGFDGRRSSWPIDLTADRIDPTHFETAVARALVPDDVPRMLTDLLEAQADLKLRADAAEAIKKAEKADKAPGAVPVLRPSSPVLADLSGYGAAAAWGETLAADLADYRAGRILWSDVDAGCLLAGPPGTGKTLFASALAATCGVAFVPTSFSEWSGAKGWGLDDVISGIRKTLDAANAAAPCILFVDEIDAVPARGGSAKADSYWAPVVAALLEGLDGTARREGVVAVAACNHPDRLDPALVRSGRLDRRFDIGLPDETALVGILGHHLPGVGLDVLEPVATTLVGTASGADAARIAREARRVARRASRDVAGRDLLAVAMPPDTRPADVRRRIAVHEAGHAVAHMLRGRIPVSLSVVAGGGYGGAVVAERPPNGLHVLGDLEDVVIVHLAGRAAEEVLLGEASVGAGGGIGSDLEQATRLLTSAQSVLGLGGYLIHGMGADGAVVEERLRRLYAETLLLMATHRVAVEALADLALEKRVLGRVALAAFAQEHLPGAGGRR